MPVFLSSPMFAVSRAKSMFPSYPTTAFVKATGWVKPLVIEKGFLPVAALM